MIALDATSGTLIGLLYVLLGLGYFILMVIAIARSLKTSPKRARLYIFQSITIPLLLFLSGTLLLWKGWCLDPILQLAQILQAIAIIYLSLKDAFARVFR